MPEVFDSFEQQLRRTPKARTPYEKTEISTSRWGHETSGLTHLYTGIYKWHAYPGSYTIYGKEVVKCTGGTLKNNTKSLGGVNPPQ